MNQEHPQNPDPDGRLGDDAGAQRADNSLSDTQFFSRQGETLVPNSLPADSVPEQPEFTRMGDYALFEQLGAGGMGVVYRAEQMSARRIVACKLIRPDRLQSLEPQMRSEIVERFRTEAQAAAKLDHPNIVTIYEVGEAEGQPFFTMRYVPGETLAAVLQTGPLDNDQAGETIEKIAGAIQHAHDQGILHRDLKPQNVLIDRLTGEPWVADFGLAKLATAESGLTRQGEVVGTPSYMSPEQSRQAGSVTPLSDVYSLGATLYHLMTGRPPFQAATPVETLRQVLLEQPVPPRSLNPAVNRDLETICLKCLEKEPQRRYTSAGLLAEDLKRYRLRCPILARPVGPLGRASRWARRNPVTASLMLTILVLVGVALATTTIGYITTSVQRRRAEQGFALAQEAVNDFFTRISEEVLLDQPGMQPYRRDLLQRALAYYQTFLEHREGHHVQLRDELAATQFRVGVIVEQLDGPASAIEHFEKARVRQLELVGERGTPARLGALADTTNAVGRARHKLNQLDAAVNAYDQAIRLRTALSDQPSPLPDTRRKLASSLMNRALVLRDQAATSRAAADMRRAQQIRQQLLASASEPRVLRDLAMGHYNWANLLIDSNQIDAGAQQLRHAIEQFQRIHDAQPFDFQNQYRLAVCFRNLADIEVSVQAAEQNYLRSLKILSPLVDRNGEVVSYRYELAIVHLNLGQLHYEQGDLLASLESLQNARRQFLQVSGMMPGDGLIDEYLASVDIVIQKVDAEIKAP